MSHDTMASESADREGSSGERTPLLELLEAEAGLQPASEGATDVEVGLAPQSAGTASTEVSPTKVLPSILKKLKSITYGVYRRSISQLNESNHKARIFIISRLRGTTKADLARQLATQEEKIQAIQKELEEWRVGLENALYPAIITAIQNLERHCKIGAFAETGDAANEAEAKLATERDIQVRLARLEAHCKLGIFAEGASTSRE